MAAGLVAFAIMFGMCSARLNFAIPWSALISLCVTLSVDPALPYSLIRVADAEDHRDRDVRRGRDTKLVAARNRWFESISLHPSTGESLRTFGSQAAEPPDTGCSRPVRKQQPKHRHIIFAAAWSQTRPASSRSERIATG